MCFLEGIIEESVCKAFDEAVKAGTKAGKYVRQYRMYLANLETERSSLQFRRETIERRVHEAMARGEEIEDAVSRWQEDAGQMENDVQQLIERSTAEATMHCFACSCPNIKWRYQLGKQAEEKTAAVNQLAAQGSRFDVVSHPRPPPPELEFPSAENYVHLDSRTPIFDAIVNALKDPEVKIIGVHGLGGIGKTTLVEKVAKNMLDDGTFKQVPLVAVSKDLNVKEIQKKLADRLNFALDATKGERGRANDLWHKFKGEKYLVILDDIWEEVDLKAIGIPVMEGNIGCKVVLTSRKEDLLRIKMKADISFPVAKLLEAEAWDLFKKKVGKTIESWPEIDSLAHEVCKKCKGLPVAINALGAALEDRPFHTWKNALDKLERHMLTQIEDIDPCVWASLWVSFDMLRSSDAQSCFLLCCLFAEDAEIPIDELMRHCMARSLLAQNPRTFDEARTAMCTVVDVLKSASLLSTGDHETVVKIHDVIRDVGISIAREKEAVLVDHGAIQWPRNPTYGPSYKAMSLSFQSIKGLPDEYPQLETLMVDNSKFLDLEVPDNFFNGMMQLKVLTFTQMYMGRLPSSLAKLASLRMLCLNECMLDDIAVLKDLTSNLEVLSLRGSNIKALPLEIKQLTGLRVLDLQDCDELMVIPRGVISDLTSLEELYFPENFDKWGVTTDEQQDTNSSDNASLEELRESLANAQLTTLHIHVPNVKLLPKEDLKFANLKGFRISVGSQFDYSEALISRTCMLKLEGIQLRNEFIPLVDKAEVLVLKRESSVHPLRLFNKLTVLIIEHFKLKYLFSPTTARGLVHLEVLKVTSCEIMRGIVGFEGQKDENEITGKVKFSKLKQLELTSLPNLISFFAEKEEMGTTMGSFSTRAQPLFNEQVIFPVLERLNIYGLGNIIKIWDKELVTVWQKQGSFCQLKYLDVSNCSKLMHVFPSNMHPLLKNLEELDVVGCETMKRIAEFEGERDEDGVTNEIGSPAREHLGMVGVTEIQDEQPLPEPKKEVESLCRPVNNDDIIVFPRLEKVILRRLPKLKSFYTETQGFFSHKVIFPVLERLTIDGLGNITKIWDKQLVAVWQEQGSFCQLTSVNVNKCEKLMHVFPSNMHPLLKNLEELEVEECETMKGIAEFEGEIDEDGVRNEVASPAREHLEMVGVIEIQDKQSLPKPREEVESLCRPVNNDDIIVFPRLESVTLAGLPKLKSFYTETQGFFSHKVAFPVLEILSFWSLDKITRIWDNQPLSEREKEAKSFFKLQYIFVYGCEQLEYVLPFHMLPQLKNILQNLKIWNCKKVEVIISSNPQEKEANNNNDTIRFPQLKEVKLENLQNLKSFICSDETQLLFSNKVAFPVLEKLTLRSLDKITRIWDNQPLSEPEKEAKSFSKLQYIFVYDCNQLEYVLPSYMLPQLKNILQELRIWHCTKVEVIISSNPKEKEATNNNDTIRFPQLQTLELKDLPNFKSFICSHETQFFFSNKVIFPVLKILSIRNMNKIIEIWDKQSTAVLEEQGFFCQLTDLDVSKCEKLMHVFHSKMHLSIKNLKVLRVSDCPTMEGIVQFEGEIDEDGLRNEVCFSELSSLELSSLPNLKSFCAKLGKAGTTEGNSTIHALPLFNGKVIFPVLKKLSIRRMNKIIEIWDKQSTAVLEEQGFFCQLTDLDVSECEKLMHVFHSKMHLPIKNLKVLRVSDCPTMEGIFEFEGDIEEDELRNELCFSKLSSLELSGLANLESFCTKLEKAGTTEGNSIIHALPLFNGKVAFPVLETLKFKDLHTITRIWDNQQPLSEAKSFSELKIINVGRCEHLEYVFPFYMLPQLKNLQELSVQNCTRVKVIISNNLKEKEATNNNDTIRFPQLKTLQLKDLLNFKSFICCETQLFFSNKVAFPVLESLDFKNLSKITRIWDEQPLSEQEKEAKSFYKLMVIKVEDCDQLEYVLPSYALPQLNNLQNLTISGCTKMEVIISNNPKEKEAANNTDAILFPQLKEVRLWGLPNLKSFICIDETQLLFSNKVVFPVLKTLKFKGLHKITRIWDNQPLSEPEKKAKSFSELQYIDVGCCEHLEYVLPFYMLPQLKDLQELRIRDCRKIEVIISNNPKEKKTTNNNDTIQFLQLKTLELNDLPNFKSFICCETQLFFPNKVIFPVLRELSIRKMHKIIEIWDKQSIAVLEEQGSFSQLTDLDVSECEKLLHVFPSKMHSLLKNLKVLRASDCPTMEGIVEFEGEIDEDGLRNELCFSKLSSLKLSGLANLESLCTKLEKAGTTEGNSIIHALPLFNKKVAFPVLETLKFKDLHKITRIWDNQPLSEPEKEAKSFCQLMKIKVEDCDQLEYVLPSYMVSQFKNLQKLKISGCEKMEVIIISNNPKEKEATNNNDTIRFLHLKTLQLEDLPILKSFICSDETQLLFSNKVTFPVLETLKFKDLHKITRIWDNQLLSEREQEAKSFCKLKEINVEDCDQLEYVLPSYALPQLNNLQDLIIRGCTKMEVIISNNPKEKEATDNNHTIQFPQLNFLILNGLPNLKSFIFSETQLFFSNKDAFPVLRWIYLDEDLKILRDGTYTKEVSTEECSTSGKESDHNGEELDEDLETPTKEECSTRGEESNHNGEELDEDLETPTTEECGTSGKQNDHNGEQG